MADEQGENLGELARTLGKLSVSIEKIHKQNEEQNNVTALMLDGFSYPLYKDLRALGYDFVRGVHNIEGINRWVRVVKASEAQKAEKETAVALIERGWEVSKSAGDAAEWNADDLDDDF